MQVVLANIVYQIYQPTKVYFCTKLSTNKTKPTLDTKPHFWDFDYDTTYDTKAVIQEKCLNY